MIDCRKSGSKEYELGFGYIAYGIKIRTVKTTSVYILAAFCGFYISQARGGGSILRVCRWVRNPSSNPHKTALVAAIWLKTPTE